ncbi:hypothetical protein [Paenibacillus sp. HJGM_3]|uniref:hypothetical protein n=1 Tax=Paenibacillus sp. HJGM_3 TaxID=3379816 RepID=UPI00385DC956
MMSRYTLTLLGLVLMTGFGIFFGVEIATRGMERIQGPVYPADAGLPAVESAAPGRGNTAQAAGTVQTGAQNGATRPQTGGTAPATGGKTGTNGPVPQAGAGTGAGAVSGAGTGAGTGAGNGQHAPTGAGLPAGSADSGVNKLGNGIGDLLQGMAHSAIRAVVGLFDGLVN